MLSKWRCCSTILALTILCRFCRFHPKALAIIASTVRNDTTYRHFLNTCGKLGVCLMAKYINGQESTSNSKQEKKDYCSNIFIINWPLWVNYHYHHYFNLGKIDLVITIFLIGQDHLFSLSLVFPATDEQMISRTVLDKAPRQVFFYDRSSRYELLQLSLLPIASDSLPKVSKQQTQWCLSDVHAYTHVCITTQIVTMHYEWDSAKTLFSCAPVDYLCPLLNPTIHVTVHYYNIVATTSLSYCNIKLARVS